MTRAEVQEQVDSFKAEGQDSDEVVLSMQLWLENQQIDEGEQKRILDDLNSYL